MKQLILLFSLLFVVSCARPISSKIPAEYDVEGVLDKYAASVVKLETEDSTCTAFYIGDELFATAFHCIAIEKNSFMLLHDMDGSATRPAVLVGFDFDHDLALLWAHGFIHIPIPIWQEPMPSAGRQIMVIGFPGYMRNNPRFEVGYLQYGIYREGTAYFTSKELGYPGQSGGPVIDVKTGQVIAVMNGTSERIIQIHEDAHEHITVSWLVPYYYINNITLN